MIGGFRSVLGEATKDLHTLLAGPIKFLVDRYREGYARMRNSRWKNSFCMSQCYLEDGRWQFDTLDYEQTGGPVQLVLPMPELIESV